MADRNRFIEKHQYLKRYDCTKDTLAENIEELKSYRSDDMNVNAEVTYILTDENQNIPLYMIWSGRLYKIEGMK